MRLQPEYLMPPLFFVAVAMDLTMVRATQRHRELVADLATEGTALRETQVVRIRGAPATKWQGRLMM
jgi:hypothetical protein